MHLKLIISVFLVCLLSNINCHGKYPGYTETTVGPIDVYYKTSGDSTAFYVTAKHETSQILSETNSWISGIVANVLFSILKQPIINKIIFIVKKLVSTR